MTHALAALPSAAERDKTPLLRKQSNGQKDKIKATLFSKFPYIT